MQPARIGSRLNGARRPAPPVTPTEKHGFGTQLIDQSAQQIGGLSRIEYPRTGVVCTLRFPLNPAPSEML